MCTSEVWVQSPPKVIPQDFPKPKMPSQCFSVGSDGRDVLFLLPGRSTVDRRTRDSTFGAGASGTRNKKTMHASLTKPARCLAHYHGAILFTFE